MTTVRREDLRSARICGAGARRAFRERGLSWAAFLRGGIDAETLRDRFGDLADRPIAAARAREQRQGVRR